MRTLGLRDAEDAEIFQAAGEAGAVILSRMPISRSWYVETVRRLRSYGLRAGTQQTERCVTSCRARWMRPFACSREERRWFASPMPPLHLLRPRTDGAGATGAERALQVRAHAL